MTRRSIIALECFFLHDLFSDFEITNKLAYYLVFQEQSKLVENFEDIQIFLRLRGIAITEDDLKKANLIIEKGNIDGQLIYDIVTTRSTAISYNEIIDKHTHKAFMIMVVLLMLLIMSFSLIPKVYIAIFSTSIIGLITFGLYFGSLNVIAKINVSRILHFKKTKAALLEDVLDADIITKELKTT
jgi:hypothetical protein